MAPKSDAQQQHSPSQDQAQTLNQMIMSFRITAMIHVAAKLGIADLLADGPQAADALAEATGTHGPSLYRLLRALASLGLFAADEQDRFRLTPLAELLRTGVPGSQRPVALHYAASPQWQTWGELLYSVTTGNTAFRHLHGMDPWEYREQHSEADAIFNDVMTANTSLQVAAVVRAYDFTGIGTVVDVGGGHGVLIAAILKANPNLRGVVCDAPHVVTGARAVLDAAGLLDRCEIVPVNFFASVPGGGDAYILKSIIHDWSDEQAITILKNCRGAMPRHGRLLLVENVIPPGNCPHPGKLIDIQMMVALGGKERTEAEYRALLEQAGFRMTRLQPTSGPLSIIEAMPA